MKSMLLEWHSPLAKLAKRHSYKQNFFKNQLWFYNSCRSLSKIGRRGDCVCHVPYRFSHAPRSENHWHLMRRSVDSCRKRFSSLRYRVKLATNRIISIFTLFAHTTYALLFIRLLNVVGLLMRVSKFLEPPFASRSLRYKVHASAAKSFAQNIVS